MGMMKGCAGALVLLLALGAQAQTASETEQLKKHFEDGSKAFNLGEFKRAVDEYKAAYNIRPDPVFLYNIAQAYRLDGNLSQALFFYKSYLTNSPRAPNRREVEGRIHELERQVAEQKAVTTAPPTGTVAPSGVTTEPGARTEPRTEPTTPPTTAPPPATTAPPPATTSTSPGTTTPGSPALTATATAPEKKTPVYKKWWLWTAVGVVAVGAAVGIGLAVGLQPSPPSSALGATRVF